MPKRIIEAAVMSLLVIFGLLPLLADSADDTLQSYFWSLNLDVTSPEQDSEVGDEFVIQGDLTAVEINGKDASPGLQDVWMSVSWLPMDDEKEGIADTSAGDILPRGEDVAGRANADGSDSQQDYWTSELTLNDFHVEGDTITAKWKIIINSETLKINEYPPGTQFKLFIELNRSSNSHIEDFEINGIVDGPYELILVYRPVVT